MPSQPVEPTPVEPWTPTDDSRKRWWRNGWVVAGWVACMVLAMLWQGVPLDLPHPTGYLLYGFGFAPWALIAVTFVRRSLSESTTLDVIGLFLRRRRRWLDRTAHAGWFWLNVVLVGGVAGWTGLGGLWMLWFGLVDLGTLVRLWVTG